MGKESTEIGSETILPVIKDVKALEEIQEKLPSEIKGGRWQRFENEKNAVESKPCPFFKKQTTTQHKFFRSRTV